MYSTIVVPLDGSAFGERALPTAVALAQRSDAALELVHVRKPVPVAAGAPPLDPAWDGEAEQQIRAHLAGLAERLRRDAHVPAKAVVVRGEVAAAIQDYAGERAAGLIVMATHGRGGVSRAWLGSVADDLVRRAPIPILLIRPDAESAPARREPLFRRVLVPLDGSWRSEEVLTHAATLGTPGRTEYLLLTVVTAWTAVEPFPSVATALAREDLARSIESMQARATDRLVRVAGSLREIGAVASTHIVLHSHPASAILEFAHDHSIDLIVLSTRVRSVTDRLLIGSVADKVIRGAEVPVLVCGPKLEATARLEVAATTAEAAAGAERVMSGAR